jgi:hypothetical protein
LYARDLGLPGPSRCNFHQEGLIISVGLSQLLFGHTGSFLKNRILNHQSIVVDTAKSGGQEEMLKRRAYCSQIGSVTQVFLPTTLDQKFQLDKKQSLLTQQINLLFSLLLAHPPTDIGHRISRVSATPSCHPLRDHKVARS